MKKIVSAVVLLVLLAHAGPAAAQTDETTRQVGRKGARQVSLSFATITQIISVGDEFGLSGGTSSSTSMFGAVDFGRFVTERLVLSFGIQGSGTIAEGQSPLFYSQAGFLYYFTPQQVMSTYLGGDLSVPLTTINGERPSSEAVGKVGVQAALKSNASIFVEGAYGGAFDAFGSRGSFRTQLGLRMLF